MKTSGFVFAFVVFCLCWAENNCESPVHILAENLQQVVTSSTLEWVSATSKQTRIPENAVVGAYQVMEDEPEENDAIDSLSRQPVYVCRAKQNGIWVPGQLRPKEPKCIVSLHGKVYHIDRYEILINIEGSGRLSWIRRDKYTIDSRGTVTGGEEMYRNFIARRTTKSHKKEGSLTHFLGKLNPSENLGKYTLVDQNNEELEFEDGEVLVETEPISYELTNMKFDYWRHRVNQESKVLGHTVLKNEDESGDIARVDTVFSYSYKYSLYWGQGHGLLTGLPIRVPFPNNTVWQGEWGIPHSKERVETYPIETYLAPGTAVNVTLKGDYGEADTPYNTTVVAIYKDGEKRSRVIKDNRREHAMRNIAPEFSPVYFLHNNSFVPTTTTTTATTTTTTEEAVPLTPPEVVETTMKPKKIPGQEYANTNKIHENNSMMSDEGDALSLKKKDEGGTGASSTATFSLLMVLLSAITSVLRVT